MVFLYLSDLEVSRKLLQELDLQIYEDYTYNKVKLIASLKKMVMAYSEIKFDMMAAKFKVFAETLQFVIADLIMNIV